MQGVFFLVGVWNVLPGVVMDTDMMVAFKMLLEKHLDMEGMRGYVQTEKIILMWYQVRHSHCGLKGLSL